MTTELAISVIVMFFILFGTGLYWGYILFQWTNKTYDAEDIKNYLDTKVPNEWQAYKNGINEGYEQGLRDGQEPPL